MLTIRYGIYDDDCVNRPDGIFDTEFDSKLLGTDFAKRVAYECSGGLEFIVEGVYKRPNGMFISMDKLTSGAKNLLLMMYTDYLCDMLYCGENCEPFIGEILQTKDLKVFSSRYYNPFKNSVQEGYPVFSVNANKVFTRQIDLMEDTLGNNRCMEGGYRGDWYE